MTNYNHAAALEPDSKEAQTLSPVLKVIQRNRVSSKLLRLTSKCSEAGEKYEPISTAKVVY